MTFQIKLLLQPKPPVPRSPALGFHLDRTLSRHDELVHVLSAQCRMLAADGGVLFFVGGFGEDRWRVDVETDLAVALEQLPGVFAGLRKGAEPFELNFYEQGIERYLTGTREGNKLRLECMSMSLRWIPDPSIETLLIAEAEFQFRALLDAYLESIERVCPSLARGPAYAQWLSEVSPP